MSEYNRTTRACSVMQFHPELRREIKKFFREKGVVDPQSESLGCCETVSQKKNTGNAFFQWGGSPDTTVHTGMLLTSEWLIWVQHGDKTGTRLNAAKLDKIRVNLYMPLLPRDFGLEISGYIGDSSSRVRGYVAMGTEPDAQKFCEDVMEAIKKANPPGPKKWFGWPAG